MTYKLRGSPTIGDAGIKLGRTKHWEEEYRATLCLMVNSDEPGDSFSMDIDMTINQLKELLKETAFQLQFLSVKEKQ